MEKWDGGGEEGTMGVMVGGEGAGMHGWLVVMYSCLKSISMQGWTEIHRPEDRERQRGRERQRNCMLARKKERKCSK